MLETWNVVRKFTRICSFRIHIFYDVNDVVVFLLASLVTGSRFMAISLLLLVVELWQFSFIRDWPEIRKLEIPVSESCPISGDWGKLQIPNLTGNSLMKCYWKLQNVRVTAFTFLSYWGKNNRGSKNTPSDLD